MIGSYEDCQRVAKSHRCANCDTRSVLLVRHRPPSGDASKSVARA
jgi:hypothetical protein